MQKYIFIGLLLLGCLTSCAQSSFDIRFDGLDAKIDSLLNLYHAAGASIAIVKGNQIIYSNGYGLRDVKNKLPVDTETLFSLGSCTKAFTAATIGILESQGKLKINDRPYLYIPELEFYNDVMNKEIQIHHLLSHGVGLSNMSSESSAIIFEPEDEDDLIPRLKYLAPAAEVGEQFMYSNYMYTLAALVGERITGKDWQSNTKELIFDPLKMTQSRVGYGQAKHTANHGKGYGVHNDLPRSVPPDVMVGRGPAGELFSSATDMSKWMISWLTDGRYEGDQVLPQDYISKATTKYQALQNPEDRPDADIGYGYGWFLENYYGHEKFHHGGSISGYCANVALFPNDSIGITVLTNQTNSSLSYAITVLIEDQIFDIERGEGVPLDYGASIVIDDVVGEPIINMENPPSFDFDKYSNDFFIEGFGTISVFVKDGHLYAKVPFTTFRLVHSEGDHFTSVFTEEVPTIMTSAFLTFSFLSENSKVTGVDVNMDQGGVVFERME